MSFADDLDVCSDSYRGHCDAMEIVRVLRSYWPKSQYV